MDKNVQLLFWGTGLTLGSAGLVWMISTLISVDKRTEVMDVKNRSFGSSGRAVNRKASKL